MVRNQPGPLVLEVENHQVETAQIRMNARDAHRRPPMVRQPALIAHHQVREFPSSSYIVEDLVFALAGVVGVGENYVQEALEKKW